MTTHTRYGRALGVGLEVFLIPQARDRDQSSLRELAEFALHGAGARTDQTDDLGGEEAALGLAK